MVISQDGDAKYIEACPSNNRICILDVTAEGNERAIISMLRPLSSLATDLPCMELAAQQLAHQMRNRWPQMNMFLTAHVPDGLGLEIVSQLAKGTWTQVVILRLSDCGLKAEAFLLLSQGSWPGLAALDVSGNCLDAEGMALLVKGNWPKLAFIILSFGPTQGAATIAHLSAANWPIQTLVIEDTPFSVDMAAELAKLQLPNLRKLYLRKSDLTAGAMSKLARADWLQLTFLSFDVVDLNAVGVLLGRYLVKSDAHGWARTNQQRKGLEPDVGLWPNLVKVRVSKHTVELMT